MSVVSFALAVVFIIRNISFLGKFRFWYSEMRKKSFLSLIQEITWKMLSDIGVRGGESRGTLAPAGLKNISANSVFRASTTCSKIVNDKKYLNTVKNSRATLVQGKRKLLKNPECKGIFNTVNSGQLCFSGQAQVAQKSWMIKNIFSIQWTIPGQCSRAKIMSTTSKKINLRMCPNDSLKAIKRLKM